MNWRWKVVIALAVVGIAGFLVWAFRSDPMRGVAIRFVDYETNQITSPSLRTATKTNWYLARFCLTNGSSHAILCDTWASKLIVLVTEKTNTTWHPETSMSIHAAINLRYIVLETNRYTEFTVPLTDFDQSLRVQVSFTTNLPGSNYLNWTQPSLISLTQLGSRGDASFSTRIQDCVAAWLRRKQTAPSVSLTIQDR